jgi:hypothetical protein
MSIIRVHDKSFEPYLTADMIKKRIQEIAADLNKDYAGKRPVFKWKSASSSWLRIRVPVPPGR